MFSSFVTPLGVILSQQTSRLYLRASPSLNLALCTCLIFYKRFDTPIWELFWVDILKMCYIIFLNKMSKVINASCSVTLQELVWIVDAVSEQGQLQPQTMAQFGWWGELVYCPAVLFPALSCPALFSSCHLLTMSFTFHIIYFPCHIITLIFTCPVWYLPCHCIALFLKVPGHFITLWCTCPVIYFPCHFIFCHLLALLFIAMSFSFPLILFQCYLLSLSFSFYVIYFPCRLLFI